MIDFWRAITIISAWTAAVAITIVLMLTGATMGWLVALVAIAGAVALSLSAMEGSKSNNRAAVSSEKSKRSMHNPDTKMQMLMEMMDDDEREAFKYALKKRMLSGDGELNYDANSIESLLDDERRSRR